MDHDQAAPHDGSSQKHDQEGRENIAKLIKGSTGDRDQSRNTKSHQPKKPEIKSHAVQTVLAGSQIEHLQVENESMSNKLRQARLYVEDTQVVIKVIGIAPDLDMIDMVVQEISAELNLVLKGVEMSSRQASGELKEIHTKMSETVASLTDVTQEVRKMLEE